MKMGRVMILVLIALVMALPILHADEVEIPFSVKVDSFKADAKAHNFDLYNTDDSDGFISNRGQELSICTFRPITKEQLELIKTLIPKHVRK